ncbi:hypothetical protein FNV43_RR18646 [Rhamnella rubrinervis]|uniref:BFN domain-containing protein n=1 Tax=Rhamnella rubrinervis TaxID=2594499 RepID=A0A8K0EBB1_9ROSA|nr:hypothetical protein FNV43_RR18646 [Rhamnella rubrinervis]
MLGAQLCLRTVSGVRTVTDQTNACRSVPCSSPASSCSLNFTVRFGFRAKRFSGPKSMFICCKSFSYGNSFGARSNNDDDRGHDYLEASLLLSETISHYSLRRRGFQEDLKWKSSGKSFPYSNAVGQGFLQRFQSPTIFLKISCDGDFLLPIVVGEFAIEKLVDTQRGAEDGDPPDQFQFLRNLVDKLGYQVNMVKITERVVNTYFARLIFSKAGGDDILSVDARPSDAINVANRCKAPIYVNKQIVMTDAIKISFAMGRVRGSKSTYDVSLDSAADGPDLLAQELDLVKNINLAVKEERYKDAAMWRDKLQKLRESIHEH